MDGTNKNSLAIKRCVVQLNCEESFPPSIPTSVTFCSPPRPSNVNEMSDDVNNTANITCCFSLFFMRHRTDYLIQVNVISGANTRIVSNQTDKLCRLNCALGLVIHEACEMLVLKAVKSW